MAGQRGARWGVRFIGGREYLLAGVLGSKEAALRERRFLERSWERVKVRRRDRVGLAWAVWVHARRV